MFFISLFRNTDSVLKLTIQRMCFNSVGAETILFVTKAKHLYLNAGITQNMRLFAIAAPRDRAYRCLHNATTLYKKRSSAEQRKSIEYPQKMHGEIVGVWVDITLNELKTVLNKDLNYVRDIFLNQIKDPYEPIEDIKLVQQALRRSGRRMRIIANPNNSKDKTLVLHDITRRPPAPKESLRPRPPVVTVMGHVDHGKTTLLDALRQTSIVEQEFGGITQHIGAFLVNLGNNQMVTFLDTPGHAAFSAMRERGANCTDIVVLVVAADDGVMEQTVESIRMARQANVPMLIAINKIDAPRANIARTERMLSSVGIEVERIGGDVQAVPISALKRQNLNNLVEALAAQAELMELAADWDGYVEAVVIESRLHPHRGKLATLVIQRGTLKKGVILVCGTVMGKVRTLQDANSQQMKEAPPGYPVEVDGWKDLPSPGELVLQVESEQRAREVIRLRTKLKNKDKLVDDLQVIEEKRASHLKAYKEQLEHKRKLGRRRLKPEGPRQPEIPKDDNQDPVLSLVIKADVDGTLEAILDTLSTYTSHKCKLDLIHYGVGSITETDVEMAETFSANIYAFNVAYAPGVKQQIDDKQIIVKEHKVIYKLIEDVKEEINKILPAIEVEDVVGEAIVLKQFDITEKRKKVPVAGCRCTKGVLKRSALYKLVRDGQILYRGTISTMKHLKEDVDTIKNGMECGLRLSDKTITFQEGDILICFETRMSPQTLDWDPGF